MSFKQRLKTILFLYLQSRNKLRLQQQEREAEQVNHAVMIRELQTLLTRERSDKELLENKVNILDRQADRLLD